MVFLFDVREFTGTEGYKRKAAGTRSARGLNFLPSGAKGLTYSPSTCSAGKSSSSSWICESSGYHQGFLESHVEVFPSLSDVLQEGNFPTVSISTRYILPYSQCPRHQACSRVSASDQNIDDLTS